MWAAGTQGPRQSYLQSHLAGICKQRGGRRRREREKEKEGETRGKERRKEKQKEKEKRKAYDMH